MKEAISGSSGFLGSTLGQHLEHFTKLDRSGYLEEEYGVIYDCASYGNMYDHTDNEAIYQANLIRPVRIINQLNETTKYIYISSGSVAQGHTTPYALSKKAAEEYLQTVNVPTAIARPFSITGVGEQKEHLIPKLINSCLFGEPMPFVGWAEHDFIDVYDVALALTTIRDNADFRGEIYEVGTGISYSNQQVLELIENITGKRANVTHVKTMRIYDQKNWVANNKSLLDMGWKPTKTLEQSIEEMVDHERKNTTNQ